MEHIDPSQNYLVAYPHPLDALFRPSSLAVIGAKDDFPSVGRTLMTNLIEGGFKGSIFPVNPNRKEVLSFPCVPSVLDVPVEVDLAVIVVPAQIVPSVMQECAKKRVKACIIISAGFKEIGEAGKALEDEVLRIAKSQNVRILGPNCLGVMNPYHCLNASFAKGAPKQGSLAFISQSGALCTAVLDWSMKANIGFSSFVSIGSMSDIDWGDLIEYFGKDIHTKSILMYMESVGDARNFLTQARRIAQEKPLIVIKPGRSKEAVHAASSHTGALSGSDAVFDAACERVGILRVQTVEQLFSMAEVLSSNPLPQGPHLAIISNAGGPAVLATDATVLEGAALATLQHTTIATLSQFLPAAWSKGNPVDIIGDATPKRFDQTVKEVMGDSQVDGGLVILTPQDMTNPTMCAKVVAEAVKGSKKPVLTSWMGGPTVEEARDIFSKVSIPCFSYPDEAAKTFATMWKYAKSLKDLYKTPRSEGELYEVIQSRQQVARSYLDPLLKEKQLLLSESESKHLLKMWGIPVLETLRATTAEEAVMYAKQIGFPVVLKLESHSISHKTDVGGVFLNLHTEKEVEQAFHRIHQNITLRCSQEAFLGVSVQKMFQRSGVELIIGSSIDPQFGPVILFGAGGLYVEVFQDKALGLPPLHSTFAEHIIDKTKISKILKGYRGRQAMALESIEKVLVDFSHMIVELPEIQECDMNPIIATEEGVMALDARIVLQPGKMVHPALRPYPIEYVELVTLRDLSHALFRPLLPEDELLMIDFHKQLSSETVRLRYVAPLSLDSRVAHERLVRLCMNDFNREIALACEYTVEGKKCFAGIIRATRMGVSNSWEIKMVIKDSCQRKGIGTLLLEKLIRVAKAENIMKLTAEVLEENTLMLRLLEKVGFVSCGRKGSSVFFTKQI